MQFDRFISLTNGLFPTSTIFSPNLSAQSTKMKVDQPVIRESPLKYSENGNDFGSAGVGGNGVPVKEGRVLEMIVCLILGITRMKKSPPLLEIISRINGSRIGICLLTKIQNSRSL